MEILLYDQDHIIAGRTVDRIGLAHKVGSLRSTVESEKSTLIHATWLVGYGYLDDSVQSRT